MQESPETEGPINVSPQNPSITPKAGWTTSQGQMTAIFTLVCLVLGYFGISKTPDQLESYVTLVDKLVGTALPIITGAVTLIYYIISRGKIQSNAIVTNGKVQEAQAQKPMMLPATLGSFDDRFTGVIGGDDWKDPERYGNLLKIAEAVGVPGVGQASKVNEKFHVDDLLKGIFGRIKGN